MTGQLPEVSLRFRVSPVFAVLSLVALWPFGVAFGTIGAVFGLGLLLLVAALGLPRSVDLNFGLMLGLATFAAQFLGGVFLGIEAGATTTAAVFTTVALWFVQLAVFGVDIHRNARTVMVGPGRPVTRAATREVARTAA